MIEQNNIQKGQKDHDAFRKSGVYVIALGRLISRVASQVMLRGIVRFLPCLFLAIIPAEGKVSVFLGESLPEIYLKPAEQSHGHLSKADLITSATSLLSVGAISHVNAETSAKVQLLTS